MRNIRRHRTMRDDKFTPKDLLQEMLDAQKMFGSKWCPFDTGSQKVKEQWTKEFVMASIDELTEVLREVNWKHWKRDKPIDEAKIKSELIDLLHFFLSLCLVWGMDAEEISDVYFDKHKENYERQKRGY